jgi:hypothetical protein
MSVAEMVLGGLGVNMAIRDNLVAGFQRRNKQMW